VFFRGLKTKIAFNIAILFFVAMLLINVVTVMTTQRDFIRKEASNGYFILSTLEADLLNCLNFDNDPSTSNSRAQVNRLLAEAGISGAVLLSKKNERIFFGDSSKPLQDELLQHCRKVIQAGKRETDFFGTTWGVFWQQPRDLVLSSPLLQNGYEIAAVSIVLPLKGIYRSVRQSQKI
jgi:hypothetical protein